MAHVSLIIPVVGADLPAMRVAAWQEALEQSGHAVEVRIVHDPGPVEGAVTGLRQARGEFFLVLDPASGHAPEDLARVVDPLVNGRADLVIASRSATGDGQAPPSWPRRALGILARRLVGTSDPLTGLIGLTAPIRDAASDALQGVGTRFSLELLGKVGGRWLDLPTRPMPGSRRWSLPVWDDLRHLKHLADHRFGNLSRLFQFCAVGASGMVVDLTCYAAFQWLLGISPLARLTAPVVVGSSSLALAAVLAIGTALTWNFWLNRRLTFSYARHGSIGRQFATYALSNALGNLLSLALRLILPGYVGFFNRHKLAAAVVGIVTATGLNFSMARWLVFRNRPTARPDLRIDEPEDRTPPGPDFVASGGLGVDPVAIKQAG